MKPTLRKHRRLFTAGLLVAFLAAWVLPAQACLATGMPAPAQSHCPDCPSPCPDATDHCCGTMAAACAASMLPTAAVAAPSLGKALPAPALSLDYSLRVVPTRGLPAPSERRPAYSPPSTVNIRYCTFQE